MLLSQPFFAKTGSIGSVLTTASKMFTVFLWGLVLARLFVGRRLAMRLPMLRQACAIDVLLVWLGFSGHHDEFITAPVEAPAYEWAAAAAPRYTAAAGAANFHMACKEVANAETGQLTSWSFGIATSSAGANDRSPDSLHRTLEGLTRWSRLIKAAGRDLIDRRARSSDNCIRMPPLSL